MHAPLVQAEHSADIGHLTLQLSSFSEESDDYRGGCWLGLQVWAGVLNAGFLAAQPGLLHFHTIPLGTPPVPKTSGLINCVVTSE